MTSSGRLRKSLGVLSLPVVAFFVAAEPRHQNPIDAPKAVADPRPLWTYDTGG